MTWHAFALLLFFFAASSASADISDENTAKSNVESEYILHKNLLPISLESTGGLKSILHDTLGQNATPVMGTAPVIVKVISPDTFTNHAAGFSNGTPYAGCLYSIDWGDGSHDPVSRNCASSLQHLYSVPGQYILKAETWRQGGHDQAISEWSGEATLILNNEHK